MINKTNTRESGFEELIEKALVDLHGYQSRQTNTYNKNICMDTDLVLDFVKSGQSKEWEKLEAQYGNEVSEKFLARLDDEVVSRGLLSVLREGISDRGVRIKLAFWKPQNNLNPDITAEYEKNILSVMRQVKYSVKNENSIDVVLFLNGLPIFTVELKNQLTGQSIINAIQQYKTDRDPKEKLLAFRRCLTHFAVDTEQVFMTTKLAGLKTYFLPFNKGDKNSSGNPAVPGKYKTSYLWEDVWSKDNFMDLVGNFIQEYTEEKENIKGKKIKEEKIIFPRYHQFDTVKRILDDSRENGSGRNYLIQHSAGSGKSNTIAWTAHRLAELHNENNENIFDGVIVVTDRRILDRQLSHTVQSFSHVVGVVKHVESSAELKESLEKGIRVITTTLQKFPVIVDTMEQTAGKKFAVIIDEAHSSQSGESAADLRQVLTLDEAEKDAEKEEKVFKTTEDLIIERMKARKVKSPNISYLAFTATPKQKTLELFGTEDLTTGKYIPFALYSMKQAIEERFILDVLKNYITYETYFGLLKKIADDPEYDKKKAERLLIGYVEKHEHAIEKKIQIIVEHFEEKITGEIYGNAKAMIVTKSRLHAVRYKIAFDKYLAEKGYKHKSLVAFSGVVKDGYLEYTESNMNKVPESQTAEEFKKDEYKFLIVAEKFQTGFDQPLLTAMYVDKKLGDVKAVQTLSRLNRTIAGKENVFVLDFVNEIDDIRDSFQPYYTTTILSEATNPNIIHDLERDVFAFKLFTEFEVNGFTDEYFNGAKPDKLNATLDAIVARLDGEKNDQEIEQFKTLVADYTRKYAFISQIVTFEDPRLEKLFIFLKLLNKKLPRRKDTLPYEILEAIDMDTYKIQKKQETSVVLDNTEGVINPMGGNGSSKLELQDEMDQLSRIIKEINERFGANFSSDDKVILNTLSEKLLKNNELRGSIENNSQDAAKIKFDSEFQSELITMLNSHFDLYKKLDENPELKKFVNEKLFDFMVRKVKN
ncbi:MAG: type I restriction endonuclease [Candidatus Taylorbacteria bacterium]|nr:type I restriction endonuclease [Candidatus Taylorbacteria bacterium]